MGTSRASGLRPLNANELAVFSGVEDRVNARISTGFIGDSPFDLIAEPHTIQIHILLEERELLTYARFATDRPRAVMLEVANALLDHINQGCRDIDWLAAQHKLLVLSKHRVGRAGQILVDSPGERLH